MKDCIFCKIVAGELPAKKVLDDDDLIAFYDIHPMAPVHVLLVPKMHINRLSEADDSNKTLLGNIQLAAAKVAQKTGISGAFRILMANGEKAGQSVNHMHYHIIGGWKDGPPPMEVVDNRKGGKI